MIAPAAARSLEARIEAALEAAVFDRAEELARDYLAAAGPAGTATWVRAQYLAAQTALAAGRLRDAVDRATPLRAADLPPPLDCRVDLILAEAHARLGQATAARAALAGCRRDVLAGNPLLALRAVRVRLLLGEVRGCAADAEACAAGLVRSDDPANAALLLAELGRAWEAADDLDRAAGCLQRAAELIGEGGPDPIRADVAVQRGRLAHLRGQFQDALDHFADADQAAPHGSPQPREVALRRLLVRLDLNQADRVRVEFDALRRRHPEPWPEELCGLLNTVGVLCGLDGEPGGDELAGYVAAGRGDRATARGAYLRALSATTAPARRARLGLALGLLAAADYDPGAADVLAAAAADARAAGQDEVLWRALDGRGRVAQQNGDDAAARVLFEEAVGVSERQAGRLRNVADAGGYRLHRVGVLRLLLAGAGRRGDAAAVFRFQELDRGRLLLDLWRAERRGGPADELAEAERRSAAELDRLLERRLLDRDRDTRAVPVPPDLDHLRARLAPGEVYVAASLVEEDLLLLVARRDGAAVLRAADAAGAVRRQAVRFREAVRGGLLVYRGAGGPAAGRRDLDDALDHLGDGPFGRLLRRALAGGPPGERVVWAADGELHGVPLSAVRFAGRYLVERHPVVGAFGGAWLTRDRTYPARRWGKCLVVTEGATDGADGATGLPAAEGEGKAVAGAFVRSARLHAAAATRAEVAGQLAAAKVAHFACHAEFDPDRPLAATVRLPSGERVRAAELPDLPLDGVRLVTLSACHSARVGRVVGGEAFGLVSGLLAAGVRAVVAGLWSVPDAETAGFMARFYRHRLTADVPTALARAQRDTLAEPWSSPFTWAVFAAYGDPAALPGPKWWARPWARWRQRRHARKFPTSGGVT